MSDAASDSEYDSEEYAECNDIESEHSTDSDYEERPIAQKKPLEKTLTLHQAEQMENEDDDDGIEEEDDEMRSLQLPDADMNVPKKVSMPPLLKNKSLAKSKATSDHNVADKPKSGLSANPESTTQVKRKLPIPTMADHFPVDAKAAVEAAREFAKEPLRGQHRAVLDHGVLRPQPCRKVADIPPGLTEIVRSRTVRTPRSQTSYAVAGRHRDLQMAEELKKGRHADNRDRGDLITSSRAIEAQKPPSPPRDPRPQPEQLRAAMAAAAARWAAGEVAPVVPIETKRKPTRWGPRHVADPNTMPKRSRWGPRHTTAPQQVHQNDQQRNQSFALALADLERAQAYQREQLYYAFGMKGRVSD